MCEQFHNWGPLIVSVILEVLVTVTMLITATVEPGIIPANVRTMIIDL